MSRPMPRYALKLEYDGAPFAGWQRQSGLPTVQGALEVALAALEADVPSVAAAGRTDAGVHATGQVAQCDMARDWDPYRLSEAINWHLKPAPIAVVSCAQVPDAWHARFSAIERRYTYRLSCRRAPLVHQRGQAWHLRHDLDLGAKSPVKSLDEITIEQRAIPNGQVMEVHLRARSFLHNQVRSITGSLERVGAGAWHPDQMAVALRACDRAACGPVAPPDGLFLTGVGYPKDIFAA